MQVHHHRHPAARKPRPPRRDAVATHKTPPHQPAVRKPRHDATQTWAQDPATQRSVQIPTADDDGCNDGCNDAGDTKPTTTIVTNARLTTSWASVQCNQDMFFVSFFLFCFLIVSHHTSSDLQHFSFHTIDEIPASGCTFAKTFAFDYIWRLL
ncbi:hypothetical protein EDB83DRAFT_2380637 [Lactarius deliciosus]|nr:hypothetical protein EDB83DRAFT_2380637 [Lactarius deliciosus]